MVYKTDHLPCVRTQSNVLQLLCENETAIFLPTVFFSGFHLGGVDKVYRYIGFLTVVLTHASLPVGGAVF